MTDTDSTTPLTPRENFNSPFVYLMLVILVMVLTTPFLQDYLHIRILLDVFYTAIFLTALYVISQEKRLVNLAAVIAVGLLLFRQRSYRFRGTCLRDFLLCDRYPSLRPIYCRIPPGHPGRAHRRHRHLSSHGADVELCLRAA
jgi:hypothetical protein